MTDADPENTSAVDETDLSELFLVFREGMALITKVAGRVAMISVFVTLSLSIIYQSSAIFPPKSDSRTVWLSRPASLSGPGGDRMIMQPISFDMPKSFPFFEQNLFEDLLVDLVAVESLSPSTRELLYNDEIYDVAKWCVESMVSRVRGYVRSTEYPGGGRFDQVSRN